jgi:acetyltransferase
MQTVLKPASVAIAGASERETSAGGAVLKNLRRSGFVGRVVPVNPRGGTTFGLATAKSLADVSPPCDLSVIAVRPDLILEAVREGVASGHRNFLILPGGFQEAGEEGMQRDRELHQYASEHDLLVLGPNCAGLVNMLDPQAPFSASFLRDLPFRGIQPQAPAIAFISQSGAIAEELIASSHAMKFPLGCVVSVGNGMHAGLIDYIQGIAADPNCRAILFYAESVGDHDRFVSAIRPIAERLAVVGLIAGATRSGAAAAKLHTGSNALTDEAAEQLCRQAGVIRVTSMRRMLLAAKALSFHPRGVGPRALILSNSGGPGVLAADRCELEGFSLAPLPIRLAGELTAALPAEAAIANPLDLLADAREDRFAAALRSALRHGVGHYDVIFMIHVVPFMVDAAPVIDALAAIAQDAPIPILHSMMGTLPDRVQWFEKMERAGVPMFDNAEEMISAAHALLRFRVARSGAMTD